MRRILVGVDGSEQALSATRLAATIASAQSARLSVVYAIRPVLLYGPAYANVIETIERAQDEEAKEILARAEAVARESGAQVETLSVRASPAEVLTELAAKPDVSMVVVGSRGRGAVARVLLGSVADRLVHICPKPVLVVR